jgi:hypothetical protein
MHEYDSMPPSEISAKPISMTIVCCVESGALEPLTIRMVDSLRRFGGRFANLEVIAVNPRMGPPLVRETKRRMSELGIRYFKPQIQNPYAWHHYTNKPEAIAAVEKEVTTDAIAWVDSDILFLKEPVHLELPQDIDFLANATDMGMVGSTGENDANDPFWQRSARTIGRNIDELPWLETGDGHRIRFYWNAGLFVYRRSTEYGRKFLSDLRVFLDRRVAKTHPQLHALDQVVLGLTVFRLGLRWKAIPNSSNFSVCSFIPGNYDANKMTDVTVLHHHDSMDPERWPLLLETIGPAHPQIWAWLEPQGSLVIPGGAVTRMAREILRIGRGVERRTYYARSGFTMAVKVERPTTAREQSVGAND